MLPTERRSYRPTPEENPEGGVIIVELSNSREEVAKQACDGVRKAIGL
jgi:hypothetical protein